MKRYLGEDEGWFVPLPFGGRPPSGFKDQSNVTCGGLAPPRALSPRVILQIRLRVAEPALSPRAGGRM